MAHKKVSKEFDEVELNKAVEKLKRIEEQERKRIIELESLDYDGIVGLPPNWVPAPIIYRFRRYRRKVLDHWGFTSEQAFKCLNNYGKKGWIWLRTDGKGKDMDAYDFHDIIGELAHIRWASSLTPEDGIRELAGDDAVRGYQARKNLKPRKKDRLTVLAEKTYKELLKKLSKAPTANMVITALGDYDSPIDKIIVEIDFEDKIIAWKNDKGKEKDTSFGQFGNKITDIKKSL